MNNANEEMHRKLVFNELATFLSKCNLVTLTKFLKVLDNTYIGDYIINDVLNRSMNDVIEKNNNITNISLKTAIYNNLKYMNSEDLEEVYTEYERYKDLEEDN